LEINLKEQTVTVTLPSQEKKIDVFANIGKAFAKYCEAVANWVVP